jgi:phosphoserine phosphatase RsbU/P
VRRVKILIVDDEEKILVAIKRELLFFSEEKKIGILCAESGAQALEILDKEHDGIGVIVSDQKMPGMSGSDLLAKVKEMYPDIVAIVLSGHSDINEIIKTVKAGIFSFILKPWEKNHLITEIEKAIEMYELRSEKRKYYSMLQEELRWGGELQKMLLARELPPSSIASFCVTYLPLPVLSFGGDYYDIIQICDETFLALIGDVSGHGIKGALVTAMLKSVIYHGYVGSHRNESFSPADFLGWLNKRICTELSRIPDILITFSVCFLDAKRKIMRFAKAGHFPLIIANGKTVVSHDVKGQVIGFSPDATYTNLEIPLAANDTVLLYTDGLVELPFGENKESNFLKIESLIPKSGNSEGFHESIIASSLSARSNGKFADDCTLLSVAIK